VERRLAPAAIVRAMHSDPRTRGEEADRLERLIRSSMWFMDVLEAARASQAPDCWVGAGALRDLVWDGLHDGFSPDRVKDVDVAFFDPNDLRPERDRAVEDRLAQLLPAVRWDAKNQAAVHLWYEGRFGSAVDPLRSAADGVATWPETATAVAVQLRDGGDLAIVAPCGLTDLLTGVWRRNPRRVTVEEYRRRLRAKRVPERWPRVRVIDS
jgi:hypothetical protein